MSKLKRVEANPEESDEDIDFDALVNGSSVDSNDTENFGDPEGEGLYYVTTSSSDVDNQAEQLLHIWILHEIGTPKQYSKLFAKLNSDLSEIAQIVLHLNSSGGSIDTGIQLINSLRQTDIHVKVIVEAEASSMAAVMALAFDELVMMPYSYLMFHDYAFRYEGKPVAHEALGKILKNINRRMDREILTGFLTRQEFQRIYKGEDIYITDEEVPERIARMNKNK